MANTPRASISLERTSLCSRLVSYAPGRHRLSTQVALVHGWCSFCRGSAWRLMTTRRSLSLGTRLPPRVQRRLSVPRGESQVGAGGASTRRPPVPRRETAVAGTMCTAGPPCAERGSDGAACTGSPVTQAPRGTSAAAVPALQTGMLRLKGVTWRARPRSPGGIRAGPAQGAGQSRRGGHPGHAWPGDGFLKWGHCPVYLRTARGGGHTRGSETYCTSAQHENSDALRDEDPQDR